MYKPPTKTSVASKVSGLRKLEPRAKRPTAAVLERFSLAERRLLDQTLSETLECVYHHSFRRPTAERRLVRSLPSESDLRLDVPGNDDSGLSLLAPPRHKVLTTEEERELFLRFNYCRYRVMLVVRRHHGKRLGLRAGRELVQWTREALQTRSTIVRLNTSLVMAMARRTRTVGVELSDLVSEGNLALLRCSDKFDCSRGFKFSTYACRAIVSAFIRLSSKAARYRSQFPAAFDPTLERNDYLEEACRRRRRLRQRVEAHSGAQFGRPEHRRAASDQRSLRPGWPGCGSANPTPASDTGAGGGAAGGQQGACPANSEPGTEQAQDRARRRVARGLVAAHRRSRQRPQRPTPV